MFQNITVYAVKKNLGQFIKLLRKREKLTQQELAHLLGMSRITIQNLEQGKNPTIDTLLLALQHFGQLEDLNDYINTAIENNSHESLY